MTLPTRAAIRASPGETPVTRPDWSTTATSRFIAIHRSRGSGSTVPSSSRTVAVTANTSPASTVMWDGSMSIRSGPGCVAASRNSSVVVVIEG